MDFFEVVRTQRAMRRLKPDPIPDDTLWTLLDTAIRAPSGGNRQPWNFVVIRDAEKKRRIGEWYRDAWQRTYGQAPDAGSGEDTAAKSYRSAEYLAHHMADAPVLILATIRTGRGEAGPTLGSSIYPAVQNLMLAARALGLGSSLTTLHKLHERDVKELLGIPDNVETMALIPIGVPRGRFGTPDRMPAEKVAYWDAWGETHSRS